MIETRLWNQKVYELLPLPAKNPMPEHTTGTPAANEYIPRYLKHLDTSAKDLHTGRPGFCEELSVND